MKDLYLTLLEKLRELEGKDGNDLLNLSTDINSVIVLIIHGGVGAKFKEDVLDELLLLTDSFECREVKKWFETVTEPPLPLWPALKICTLIRKEWPEELTDLINRLDNNIIKHYENNGNNNWYHPSGSGDLNLS